MLLQELAAVTLLSLQAGPATEAPAAEAPAMVPPPAVKIDLLEMAARKRGCKANKDDPGIVVVCGKREADRYRIDPDTLAVMRHKDPVNTQPDWHTSLAEKKCSPVGQFGCLQSPAFNFLAVAGVLARLAKGESIASIAKTNPNEYSDYEAYKRAKGIVDDADEEGGE